MLGNNFNDKVFRPNLLGNGLDFILSAAEQASKGEVRSLKYSMLHLADGIELLIKARLEREHWALLFQRIEDATAEKLKGGDFTSVNFDNACARLKNIAGTTLEESFRLHVGDLRRIRNRITHYSAEIDPTVVKSLVAKCMSHCISFCETEGMLEDTPDSEELFQQILKCLSDFQEFVEERLEQIADQLQYGVFIECGECWQETLSIDDGEAKCLFCSAQFEPEELAATRTELYLEDCPECFSERTVAYLGTSEEALHLMCLACGASGKDLEECWRCGLVYTFSNDSELEFGFCENCLEDIRRQ